MHRECLLRIAGRVWLGLGVALGARSADTAAAPPEPPAQAAPQRVDDGRSLPARVVVPPYRSPLDTYRTYRPNEPIRPWREANDEAGQLGGHAGQLNRTARPGVQP